MPRPGRARPLPPEERRAAIVAATVPLVYEHGYAVSTRQIAEAADVAEGTLFRVFPDKQSLLDAAIARALDPHQGVRALESIDPDLPLEDRVTAAVEILRTGLERTWQLFTALRGSQRNCVHNHAATRNFAAWDLLIAALAKVVEPDAYRLAVPPLKAARVIGTTVIVSTRQLGTQASHASTLTTAETVDVLLHGLARPGPRHHPTQQNGSSTC